MKIVSFSNKTIVLFEKETIFIHVSHLNIHLVEHCILSFVTVILYVTFKKGKNEKGTLWAILDAFLRRSFS